jgi:DNA-binding MurR/RpiR family transcriptional regulator
MANITPSSTIADRIRLAAGQMTPAEQKIARILFSSAMLAGLDTVASLAERAGVSGPTVIRLTTKLGYASYLDFQKALREELEERSNSPLSLFEKAARPVKDDVLAQARELFAAAISSSFNRVSPSEFQAVVDILADTRLRLFLTGGRFTQMIADMLFLHLFQMRPNVQVLRSGLQSRTDQLLDLGQKSVLMVHDVRRYQADSVELARRAKDRGATILLMTDPWESPIAEFADHVLIVEVTSPSPFDSMIPAFAMTEALIAAVMQRLGKDGIRRMREIEELRTGFEWKRPRDERGRTKTGSR